MENIEKNILCPAFKKHSEIYNRSEMFNLGRRYFGPVVSVDIVFVQNIEICRNIKADLWERNNNRLQFLNQIRFEIKPLL